MAKRKNNRNVVDNQDESKLSALVEAEEQIEEEVLAEDSSDVAWEQQDKPSATNANINLDDNAVKSPGEGVGEAKQDGAGNRHINSLGEQKLAESPDASIKDTDASKVAHAEAEKVSKYINSLEPNAPTPESKNETVAGDEMVSSIQDYEVDVTKQQQGNAKINKPKVEGMGAPKDPQIARIIKHDTALIDINGQSVPSTEGLDIDQIPIPVETSKKSEQQLEVERIAGVNRASLYNGTSTHHQIDPSRPMNVFQQMAQASNSTEQKKSVESINQELKTYIEKDLGIDVSKDSSGALNRLIETLDSYAAKMGPRNPVTEQVGTEYQQRLYEAVASLFNRETAVGVAGLNILQAYMQKHQAGAFGDARPFRWLNNLKMTIQPFRDVIFTVQAIARDGAEQALKDVSKQKLKESVGDQDAQIILMSYLNSAK